MNNIPIINLKREYEVIGDEVSKKITTICKEGRFIGGADVEKIEEDFSNYIGCKYGIGVASGTAALFLGLAAIGVGEGDEVITTSMSFNATAEAIAYTGAKIVFADIVLETGVLDIKDVRSKITEKTKAVIFVHLYGNPTDLTDIADYLKQKGIFLIEDCAQSHGAHIEGKKTGSYGDIGAFSFMPAKNLGCYGDGGMVVTSDIEIGNKVRMLKDHGRESKYKHVILGYGERLDNLQAGVLNVKLPYLDTRNQRRANINTTYRDLLDTSYIRFLGIVENGVSSHYVFPIFTNHRDKLKSYLSENNISSGIYYPIPLHLQPVFGYLGYKKGDFPNSELLSETTLALPMNPFLNDKEVEHIVSTVNAFKP